MQPAEQLKQLLASGTPVGTNLTAASAACDAWYLAEPSLSTFVLRAIFRHLLSDGFDDPQGIPTAVYQQFQNGMLPHIIRIIDTLVATPAAEPIGDLDTLTVAYRDTIRLTP